MASRRARSLTGAQPPLVTAHFACQADPFNARTNPRGYINLGTAENDLLWDVLGPKLRAIHPVESAETHYDYLYGSLRLRRAFANYVGGFTSKPRTIDPETIVVATGCSAILDILATSLCNPGEAMLLPAPYYSGFNADLTGRADAVAVPVPLNPKEGFPLSIAALDQALKKSKGRKIKAILLASPNNPLGHVFSAELVRDLIEFAKKKKLHIIFDEIYARSVFGRTSFTSVLNFSEKYDHVHFVYGLAKDFGLSGFKVGMLQSQNQDLIAAMRQLTYFSTVSTHTQSAMAQMLEDPDFLSRLHRANRERLAHAYAKLSGALASMGVPHVPAEAGVFVLADFRKYLKGTGFTAEQALWKRLFESARVSISPGQIFATPQAGWFRICYAKSDALLDAAIERIRKAL